MFRQKLDFHKLNANVGHSIKYIDNRYTRRDTLEAASFNSCYIWSLTDCFILKDSSAIFVIRNLLILTGIFLFQNLLVVTKKLDFLKLSSPGPNPKPQSPNPKPRGLGLTLKSHKHMNLSDLKNVVFWIKFLLLLNS